MLKTSHQWYQEDKKWDICDPDGWPRTHEGPISWYYVLILHDEYEARVNLSTCVSYNLYGHHAPFQIPDTPHVFKPSEFCDVHTHHCKICDGPTEYQGKKMQILFIATSNIKFARMSTSCQTFMSL